MLFQRLWSVEERQLHINMSELRLVQLMLLNLKQTLFGQVIQTESDKTTTVMYINKTGEVHSRPLNQKAMFLYDWVIPMEAQLQAVYCPGVDSILADYLSRHVASLTEWMLDRRLVSKLFEMWDRLQIDLCQEGNRFLA